MSSEQEFRSHIYGLMKDYELRKEDTEVSIAVMGGVALVMSRDYGHWLLQLEHDTAGLLTDDDGFALPLEKVLDLDESGFTLKYPKAFKFGVSIIPWERKPITFGDIIENGEESILNNKFAKKEYYLSIFEEDNTDQKLAYWEIEERFFKEMGII